MFHQRIIVQIDFPQNRNVTETIFEQFMDQLLDIKGYFKRDSVTHATH